MSDPAGSAGQDAMDVSIIIVNWNTREMLSDCLASIYRHTEKGTFEVIVVDNASSDGSAEMVARDYPQVVLLRNDRNLGFAAANNQGIRIAKGRYVLLLNSDTLVHEGSVEKSLRFADQHADTAVVGCHVKSRDGTTQYTCYTFPGLLNVFLSLSRLSAVFPRNRFFGRYRLTWWDHDAVQQVDAVAGCFMLVRRRAVEEVGPLSERYFMYAEDVDWCWRFRQGGWKTMFTPDAAITHFGQASSSQCAADMLVRERQSLLMFLETKSGRLTRWVANAMFGIAAFLRLPLLLLKRLRGGETSEHARQQWPLAAAALRFHLFGRVPNSF